VPFVQTLHGNWSRHAAPPNTICLSRDHAKRHGSTIFVYNGLDPAEYIFRRRKEQWDLVSRQAASDRGYHWAVEREAHRPPAHHRGRLATELHGPAVKYVGEVGGNRKAVLLARARCLWMPAQWTSRRPADIEALFSALP